MSEYVCWVWEGNLARGSRPGYPKKEVDLADMANWMEQVRAMQVRSIICLLTKEQLEFYHAVPNGLLGYYRDQGLEVIHLPITDPAHNPSGKAELESALDTIYRYYQQLPKPVLIHCSAGQDRTGGVVEDIQRRSMEDQPGTKGTNR